MTAAIRPALPGDETGIAHVRVATWRSQYRGLMADAVLDALDQTADAERWGRMLRNPASASQAFVAVEPSAPVAGGIVAFAVGGPNRDEAAPFNAYAGELYAIYVLDAYQGRGLGRRLFEDVVRDLREREMRSMILWVLRENPARAFYKRMGGVYVGEKTAFLENTTLTEAGYGWASLPDTDGAQVQPSG